MGSDSAYGEPLYGRALEGDERRKALAAAIREAEQALAEWSPEEIRRSGPSVRRLVLALRSLLRALPAEGEAKPETPRNVHEAHCYMGDYEDTCKYGDDDCPARPAPQPAPTTEDERLTVTVSRRCDDAETLSFDGSSLTTVRACRDCGVLIAGGPTRCLYCADKLPRLGGDGRDGFNGSGPFEG